MRITSFILLLATIFAISSVASAQPKKRDVVVASFEDTSCGAWERSKNDAATREVYLYWFMGFVSGYNYGSKTHQASVSAIPDNDTLALYIDKFCREKPLSPFVSAAQFLVHEQGTRRGR